VLNFSHTYLYFKDLIRTYLCEIYVLLWDLIEIKRQVFNTQIPNQTALAVDRTVDRTRSRSTVTVDRCAREVHKGQPTRPVDRAVDQLKAPHSRVGAG